MSRDWVDALPLSREANGLMHKNTHMSKDCVQYVQFRQQEPPNIP